MSAQALTLPVAQAVWRPKVNPWVIGITVSMAAFVEVLDTSVANVALPYISGGLSVGRSQSTWVLTSYLVANAIVLPLSGWLMVTSTPVRIPTVVFGLFDLPYPLAPDIARFRLAHAAHIVLAIALAVLVVLHVAAALIHAWVWRDRTLARMWLRAG